MADVIAEFFDALADRGHEPQLERVTSSVRIDVMDGGKTQRWLVSVEKGDIDVSRRNARADLVIGGDRTTLERVFSGDINALAALLRGELTVSGASELLVLFRRFVPRPQDASSKGVPAGYTRRQQ